MPRPYASAHTYLDAGWTGIVPLPERRKAPVPPGYTGAAGTDPSPMDIETWVETRPESNLGLRLPKGVIGIDVDHYSDKQGLVTIAEAATRLGDLPLTYISTSRSGGSGIRLFRVPEDHAPHGWRDLGRDVETIHHGWRYIVAWPSIHPDTGEQYQWVDQATGELLDAPPVLAAIPWLPSAWANELAQPEPAQEVVERPQGDIVPGSYLGRALDGLKADLEALTWQPGVQWDTETFKVAARLAELAKSDWNELTPEHAHAFLHEHAPLWLTPTKQWPQTWTSKDVEAKWRSGWGRAEAVAAPAPKGGGGAVDESLFDSRFKLTQIRDFARARRTSPLAVLAVALTRVVTATSPAWVLPPIIGGEASLNLFVGVVGRSGGGKGAAESAAKAAVVTAPFPSVGVGSGEGVLHQYCYRVPADKKTGEPSYIEQFETSVLFTASEVDTLAAVSGRQSSTLLPALRNMYMGEELSFAYADPAKRLMLNEHTYRAGLVIGIQPSRAGVLLGDADGGTPQRFLWVPAEDRGMPDVPPPMPDALQVPRMPVPQVSSASSLEHIKVCQQAIDTIVGEHIKRNRGEGDALDGHALLTRLKWAAAFALLEGRPQVDDEDWEIAGELMAVSDRVRDEVAETLAEADRRRNVKAGEHAGHRDAARDEVIEEKRIQRVATQIMGRFDAHDEWSVSDLRRSLNSANRPWLEEAIDRLERAGQVSVAPDGTGHTVRRV